MDFFFQPSIEQLPNVKAAVAFIPDSGAVFREDTRLDTRVLNGGQRFVPWGMDNAMPYDIISKVEDDETLATCMQFNAEVCYGAGLQYNTDRCTAQVQNDIEDFLLQNDLAAYFLGVCQDFKYFAFAIDQLLHDLLPQPEWLDSLPLVPVRLPEIGRHKAVAADLTGVPFAD